MNEFEIWIYRGLILTLSTIAAWMLKNHFDSQKVIQERNELTFQNLQKAISDLRMLMVEMQQDFKGSTRFCQTQHTAIDSTLQRHDREIEGINDTLHVHSTELGILREKMKPQTTTRRTKP